MARGRSIARSASTGRFVSKATARRNPSRTTTERVGGNTANNRAVNRSAGSGRFVTEATARRHPDTTVTGASSTPSASSTGCHPRHANRPPLDQWWRLHAGTRSTGWAIGALARRRRAADQGPPI